MANATEYSLSSDGGRLAGRLATAVLSLLALTAAVLLGARWLGPTIARGGHTDSLRAYEIVIGDDVLSVPANMIRFSSQRRDGAAGRLDLYAKWPGLTGYAEADRAAFNLLTPRRELIFMTIGERAMSRDMSGRYLPIYAQLIEPQGRPGPAGLTLHDFTDRTAYKDEELALSDASSGQPAFVARCMKSEAAEEIDACERDLQFGRGLQILYRFPRAMLGQWKELDDAVRAFAKSRLLGN